MIFDVFQPEITKESEAMTLDKSALTDLLDALRAGGDLDVLREAMQLVLQALIEAEADQAIGAGRYERTDTRTTHRNGGRARLVSMAKLYQTDNDGEKRKEVGKKNKELLPS